VDTKTQVTVAKTAGFCFGVKRAVDMVYERIGMGEKVTTYGPIIHNEAVVEDLASRGVHIANTPEELEAVPEGTVIIRSHGAPKAIYDLLNEKHLNIVDATCPFVKKIHNIVHEQCEAGMSVLIIGDPAHPEVQGIKGWGDDKTIAADNLEDILAAFPDKDKPIAVVAQTTFNLVKFQEIVAELGALGYHLKSFNTICNATVERQEETAELASVSDMMVVIGSPHSSNTRKLYEISKQRCDRTFFVSSADELKGREFPQVGRIGITAGASAPDNIIAEVSNYVRSKF
jgi:4-hydroxy-3-methylbut-2-en-1-yl diphosphate reductase